MNKKIDEEVEKILLQKEPDKAFSKLLESADFKKYNEAEKKIANNKEYSQMMKEKMIASGTFKKGKK